MRDRDAVGSLTEGCLGVLMVGSSHTEYEIDLYV